MNDTTRTSKTEVCATCAKPLPPLAEWSMPSCPTCVEKEETNEVLTFLGELMCDFVDREKMNKADIIGRAINLIVDARPAHEPPAAPFDRRRFRNEIGSFDLEPTARTSDNLAIALCSYFEAHMDRPKPDPQTEHGWGTWAEANANRVLDELADFVLTRTAEPPAGGRSITLNGYQLREALELVAPDMEQDQLEAEVFIQYGDNGHSGSGFYCCLVDCPEEGSILLADGLSEANDEYAFAGPPADPKEVLAELDRLSETKEGSNNRLASDESASTPDGACTGQRARNPSMRADGLIPDGKRGSTPCQATNYTLHVSYMDDTGRLTITSPEVPGLLIWAKPEEAFADVPGSVMKLRLLNAKAELRAATETSGSHE